MRDINSSLIVLLTFGTLYSSYTSAAVFDVQQLFTLLLIIRVSVFYVVYFTAM